MPEISVIAEQFGPTGVVVLFGIYALRALMPLVVTAVGHLGRMADAMQQLVLQVKVIENKVDTVVEQTTDLSEDLAGLYGQLGKSRPSRGTLRGAAGD